MLPNYGSLHFLLPKCIITPNLRLLAQIILEMCSGHDYSKTKSEVKVTVTRKRFVTLHHSKMHLHTKFGILSKKHRRYAPDSMQFLETMSEVKFSLTVTQLWYGTLCHPKMHPNTKFEIPT